MRSKLSGKEGISQVSLAGLPKALGYAPGIWYGKDDYSEDAQRRFGNLVTGTGLGLAGALSVPALQWLFPKIFSKFPGQGSRLAIAAMLGGVALPFAATLPAEIRAYRNYSNGIPNVVDPSKLKSTVKKATGQYSSNFPMMKSHLATSVLDEISAGALSTEQAAKFMQGVGQQTEENQPWFTVGDVTRAALGAGAGALTGNLMGKGVSFFLGLTPKGRKNIRNVGMGLGALINTGKIGF